MSELLSLARAARRLGLTARWLRAEADAGWVPCLRAGTRYLFDLAALKTALAERAGARPDTARDRHDDARASGVVLFADPHTFGRRRAAMSEPTSMIPAERIERAILLIRGHKVMLDSDLAALYGVETKSLVRAVKRNLERFPADFMFQLTTEEFERLWGQFWPTNVAQGRGGRRYAPYAFTEQGVAMLSSVLRSSRAVAVNVEIMRAFVRLRQMLTSHADLARKLENLEKKYDAQFKIVFDAIRQLMLPPETKPRRKIGFHTEEQHG
jgi:hypothetical protein